MSSKSPFKFLDAYTLEDKDSFFGREKEIEALYEAVNKNRLVLVYGQSGTGKTSLVQCGLAGRFDVTDWHPVFVRRHQDINASLRQALHHAGGGSYRDDLLAGIERLNTRLLRPIYLIFDQLEELLILGSEQEQQAFIGSLQQILAAETLSCHLLLIIREEYLAWLYSFEKAIPGLFDRRLRVEPMSNARVKQMLGASFARFNIALEAPPEKRLEEIIDNVNAGRSGIQLPYLQVYLDLLWREDLRRTYGEGPPETQTGPDGDQKYPALTFTQSEIADMGPIEDVLDRFLQEQQEQLQAHLAAKHPGWPADGLRLVLDAFVTAEGTKRPLGFRWVGEERHILLEEGADNSLPALAPAALTECLQALEQRRLLRFTDNYIEPAHDSLAALIDRRRTDEQRQLNEVKGRLRSSLLEWQRTGEYLSRKQLISVEPFLERLALESALQRFVADSYAFNDRREQAEQQRQQQELDKERLLRSEAEAAQAHAEEARQQAENHARQSRRRTRIAAVLALLAVAALALAVQQFGQAKTQAQLALDNAAAANQEKSRAEMARRDAEQDRLAALVSRDSTRRALTLADSLGLAAETAAGRTQQALNELRATSVLLLDSTLSDAQRDILALDYDAAEAKCRNAARLGIQGPKVGAVLMEIAFFRAESGRYAAAAALVQETARLYGGRHPDRAWPAQGDSLTALRSALKGLDRPRYVQLELRYFPDMVAVAGGTFWMGCDTLKERDCNESELPRHEVQLSDFRIARTETTVWQYYLFVEATRRTMPATPPWQWNGHQPVVYVSWYDALAYANWLSRQRSEQEVYRLDIPPDPNDLEQREDISWSEAADWNAGGFRPPTEAEWEYAARGGNRSQGYIYAGSDSPDLVAWYWVNNNPYGAKPVKKKAPNELGLYDMSGNVWEWCWDVYDDDYYASAPDISVDPTGPAILPARVLRGGAWSYYDARDCRAAYRNLLDAYNRGSYVGFRVAQD